jgi:hypothetical protein
MNLGQWQAARNGGVMGLIAFDPLVTAYHAANNDFDRLSSLGDLLYMSYAWLAQNHGLSVLQRTPVDAIRNDARQDLGLICGANHILAIYHDIINHFSDAVMAAKQVMVNASYIHPIGHPPPALERAMISHLINQHIATANASTAFQNAGITINRANVVLNLISQDAVGNPILLPAIPAVPVNVQGTFQDSALGGQRLISVCNAAGAVPNLIDIVYVRAFDQADIQGRTFRAGANYGVIPQRSIVCVRTTSANGGVATYGTTLLHELGHALTHCPGHSSQADQLMASGAIRNGQNGATSGQIGWFRNNPYAH